MAITTNDIWFETQRRAVLYKSTTVMPDNSLLGYDGDPSQADKDNSDGEQLLYYSAQGSMYMDSSGTVYLKQTTPDGWVVLGSGGGGGSGSGAIGPDLDLAGELTVGSGLTATGDTVLFADVTLGADNNTITLGGQVDGDIIPTLDSEYNIGSHTLKYDKIFADTVIVDTISSTNAERLHVLSRGSFVIDTPSAGEREFICMQQDNFAGDAKYGDVDNQHAFVLPYNGHVKRVILRAGASTGDEVIIGIHTNNGLTPANGYSYTYFAQSPVEEISKSIAGNNVSTVYNFTPSSSGRTGDTIGISVSAGTAIDATSITIVLGLDEST